MNSINVNLSASPSIQASSVFYGKVHADRLTNGTHNAILGSDGKLTVPGAITSSGNPVATWTSSITAIDLGVETIITLADNRFVAPIVGQVIISGVQGTTQANGTWYYQAWNVNQIRLYSDENTQTPIDSTSWSAYTSGGTVLNEMPPGVVLTSGTYSWDFDSTGAFTLPTGGTLILTSPNGTKYSLGVQDNGDLITTVQ